LTEPTVQCHRSSASEAPRPGRHPVGTPGAIKSQCLGGFTGIGTIRERARSRPCSDQLHHQPGHDPASVSPRAANAAGLQLSN
jgi:hypothetical protein